MSQLLCAVPLAAAACASGTQPAESPSPTAAPMPDACHGCRAHATVELTGARTLTLWLGTDRRDYQSRPMIELRDHGVAVQWWIAPKGDGWNGSLRCLTSGPEPNCLLLDSLGMHSSVAQLVILRAGRLVHPAAAKVVTDVPGMRAADLDGDGYLDVIGTTNDYQPNFAQGHNYWQTFRYGDGRFDLTGCAPLVGDPAPPTQLLTGRCPAG